MVILITTSRNPTHYLRRMSKVIAFSIPNSQKLTRGSLNLREIFRYCWNHQIFRLLILQKDSEVNSMLVKAYSIRKKPRLINATIRITDVISLQKSNKRQRITIEKVKLNFGDGVGKKIMEKILDFFSPINLTNNLEYDHSTELLTITFKKNRLNSLIGHVVQYNSSKTLPLYNIHITSGCISNEQQI